MGNAYGEGQIILAMERGGNGERGTRVGTWLAKGSSKSRAFPSYFIDYRCRTEGNVDLGEKQQRRSTAAYQTENTSSQ